MLSKETKKYIKEKRLKVFDIGDVGEDYILYDPITNEYQVTDGLTVNPCPADLELHFVQGVVEGSWINI